jgi:four helix bundle protein
MKSRKSLLAWQRARSVVDRVFTVSARHWSPQAAAAIRQLQSSALSVQLNIAEGYARGSRKAFRNHLAIAYGSAMETTELLEVLIDHRLIPAELGRETLLACRELQALLLGLIHRYSDRTVRSGK